MNYLVFLLERSHDKDVIALTYRNLFISVYVFQIRYIYNIVTR